MLKLLTFATALLDQNRTPDEPVAFLYFQVILQRNFDEIAIRLSLAIPGSFFLASLFLTAVAFCCCS